MTFWIIWLAAAVLVAPAGMNRKIGIAGTFGISLLFSPIVALIVVFGSPRLQARGCAHCGNKENEAEYWGLCGLNAAGEQRPV